MAGKKSSMGAVVLWFVMVALVGVAVTEFYGPFRGWLRPTAEKARDKVSELKDDYQKRKQDEQEKREKDEAARKLAEQQKADAENLARRSRVIGLDEYPRTAMVGSSLIPFQTDGEVTPADLPMQDSNIPEPPKRKTAKDVLARLNGRKLVRGSAEYKAFYKEIYGNKLAELEEPEVGQIYTVELRDDTMLRGMLKRRTKDAAMFSTDDGALRELLANKLSLKSLKEFFPKIYADRFAAHYMAKVTVRPEVVAKNDPKEKDPDPKTTETLDRHFDEEDKTPTVVVKRPPNSLPELKSYDPTYAKTPKHLAPAIQYFGGWVDSRGKAAGGRIANKLYAKQHGKQVVLYMEMSRYFLAQKKDVRQQTCEQFWQMWTRECKNRGKVGSPNQAHVVMVDGNGKIVGGSKEKSADSIWVK